MKTHHLYTITCGLLLTAIGLFIRYQIGRRRFNRRGMAGLQQFASYGEGLWTTIIETIIYRVGTMTLWAGIFLLAIAGLNHHFKF